MDHSLTCEEFKRILLTAADQMRSDWVAEASDAPQIFPATMSLEDWWTHFSKVTMAERLLTPEGRDTQPSSRSHAA
jgi:hypothetical protein